MKRPAPNKTKATRPLWALDAQSLKSALQKLQAVPLPPGQFAWDKTQDKALATGAPALAR